MNNILSIDLGLNMGWAFYSQGIIESGNVKFIRKKGRKTIPDDHEGKVFNDFYQWLVGQIRTFKVDGLIFENITGHLQGISAFNSLCGMRAILLSVCAKLEVPVLGVNQKALKLKATGNGKADKDEMLYYANGLSDNPIESHDEADAFMMVFIYKMGLIDFD